VIRKSRLVLALGLTVALGVSGIALAGGGAAADNVSQVKGKVNPKKLDKKKFKPVNLFSQVATDYADPTGDMDQHTEQVFIDFGKNIKFKLGKAQQCSADISGEDTAGARAACPGKSFIGQGEAHAILASPTGDVPVNDLVVSAFAGPGDNQLRLHAYTDSLPPTPGANPSVVVGDIVKSRAGKKYGKRLSVEDAPDILGDTGALSLFNAKITKKSKTVVGRCKAKKFRWKATWVYDDGSSDTDTTSQKCKRKK
jgi:hypothetical protein